MVRQGCVGWVGLPLTTLPGGPSRTHPQVSPSGRDHHQVVHDGKPVTGRCIGDGTEGGNLRFRGTKRPVAAISDKDAAGCLASHSSQDYRAGREAGCLDPADGDDGVSDEAVTVVHIEDKRHVLPAVEEQFPSGAGSARRIVNPTGQGQVALLERLGMSGALLPRSEDCPDAGERSWDHRGALR